MSATSHTVLMAPTTDSHWRQDSGLWGAEGTRHARGKNQTSVWSLTTLLSECIVYTENQMHMKREHMNPGLLLSSETSDGEAIVTMRVDPHPWGTEHPGGGTHIPFLPIGILPPTACFSPWSLLVAKQPRALERAALEFLFVSEPETQFFFSSGCCSGWLGTDRNPPPSGCAGWQV